MTDSQTLLYSGDNNGMILKTQGNWVFTIGHLSLMEYILFLYLGFQEKEQSVLLYISLSGLVIFTVTFLYPHRCD